MGAIQVKNVPEQLHTKLRRRAAKQGRTVSGYVLTLLQDDLERPSWDEWLATLDTQERMHDISNEDVIAALDEAREEREAELERAHDDRH